MDSQIKTYKTQTDPLYRQDSKLVAHNIVQGQHISGYLYDKTKRQTSSPFTVQPMDNQQTVLILSRDSKLAVIYAVKPCTVKLKDSRLEIPYDKGQQTGCLL